MPLLVICFLDHFDFRKTVFKEDKFYQTKFKYPLTIPFKVPREEVRPCTESTGVVRAA